MSQDDPSVVEDLLRRTRQVLSGAAADCVERFAGRFLRRALRKLTSHLVAAAVFAASSVFLMIAGVEGLRSAGLAPWAAYLVLGLAGVLSGAVILLCSRDQRREA